MARRGAVDAVLLGRANADGVCGVGSSWRHGLWNCGWEGVERTGFAVALDLWSRHGDLSAICSVARLAGG